MCAVQVQFIKQRLRSDLRKPAAAAFVEVSTIDAFQGREADIIILSCVRAPWHGGNGSGSGSARSNVGFLQDVRRMNVALTRARRSLWVLGHVESLVSSRPWRSLAEHAGATLPPLTCLHAFSAAHICLVAQVCQMICRIGKAGAAVHVAHAHTGSVCAAKEECLFQALPKYSDMLRMERPKLAVLPVNAKP